LLKKIQNTFDAEEQQLFVASFYCYLKYDPKKEFVINFEDVWKWCGFTRKSDAKKLLEKFFTKDIDYKVEKAAAAIAAAGIEPENKGKKDTFEIKRSGKNKGGAGMNKEHILLTVNCFKKFCMKAGTKKADQIHDYYIKLEELLQETLQEQSDELQKQLEIKDKTLQFKNELIQQTKKEADRYKVTYNQLAKTHDQLKLKRIYHKFKKGKCLYIVSDKWRSHLYYKFGESDDIDKRLQTYRTSMPECRIEFLVYLNESEFLEKCVKFTYSKNLTSLNHEYVVGIPLLDLIADVKHYIKKFNFSVTFEENLSSYNDPYCENQNIEQREPVDTIIYDEKEESKDPIEPVYDEKDHLEESVESIYDEKNEESDTDDKEDSDDAKEDEEPEQEYKQDLSTAVLHKCDLCNSSYKNHGKLVNHRKKVHNIEDTTDYTICPLCKKKFTNKGKMTRHIRSVHEKSTQVKCDECNSIFADKANLKAHIKQVHTKETAIKCEECGITCTSKGNLKRHMDFMHLKVKIPCVECGKMLPPANMTHHINLVHKKLEASECTICHKILASKLGLEYHMTKVHKIYK
jgi:phage anti-repressor protein